MKVFLKNKEIYLINKESVPKVLKELKRNGIELSNVDHIEHNSKYINKIYLSKLISKLK